MQRKLLNEAAQQLVEVARCAVKKWHLDDKRQQIVVALSGGADSVALLLVLRALGCAVSAAHCNFQLRGADADADEEYVRELCRGEDIPLHVTRFETETYAAAHKLSIETAARELRYAWFEQLAQEKEMMSPNVCVRIAVAHHREDQLETFFLHLVRGAGVEALAGMPATNGRIVRPLLEATRQQIESYLAEQQIAFCTDATNADTVYRRNYIRHKIMPLFRALQPKFDDTLNDTLQRLREAACLMQREVLAEGQQYITPCEGGRNISLKAFETVGEWRIESPTLLYEWLKVDGFSSVQVKEIIAALRRKSTGALWQSDTHDLTLTEKQIEVRRRIEGNAPICLQMGLQCLPDGTSFRVERLEESFISRSSNCATLDAEKVKGKLVFRHPLPGERFRPFGMKGTKLVSDYLTDLHLSRLARERVWCVCDEDGIVWLVNYRVAQRVAVTAATKSIYRLTLLPVNNVALL